MEGRLEQHRASLLPSLNQLIATAVQSAVQQQQSLLQQGLYANPPPPPPPVLEASTSSSGVLNPAHRLPYLTSSGKKRAHKCPASGGPSRAEKMRKLTPLPPPPPALPLQPPQRKLDDDSVSLYCSSSEFSQNSEGDGSQPETDTEEDQRRNRLKSVVVVPDPVPPAASVEGRSSQQY